ncbi:MAG: hypothetical protein R3F34_18270 [Planctomycetota bacterium]
MGDFLDTLWHWGLWSRIDENERRAARTRASVRSNRRVRLATGARIDELERKVDYLALVVGTVMEELDSGGVVTRERLRERLAEVDARDGAVDGRLDAAAAAERGSPVAGFENVPRRPLDVERPEPVVRRTVVRRRRSR